MTAAQPSLANDLMKSGVQPERADDRAGVDALVAAAFGPGRFAKTAERLRERATLAAGFVALEGGRIVGSVRLWTVAIGDTSALFLGPIAVDAERRKGGLGAELVTACVEQARRVQADGVLLVGDLAYFDRFGFGAAADVRMPGPVDRHRVLWLPIGDAAPSGTVRGV